MFLARTAIAQSSMRRRMMTSSFSMLAMRSLLVVDARSRRGWPPRLFHSGAFGVPHRFRVFGHSALYLQLAQTTDQIPSDRAIEVGDGFGHLPYKIAEPHGFVREHLKNGSLDDRVFVLCNRTLRFPSAAADGLARLRRADVRGHC